MDYYALIMAGGVGTRLWPRSRIKHPKQFLDITGNDTMLRLAYKRIENIIRPEKIFIATNQDYFEIVHAQLPEIPVENILSEPVGRGTAAAIGLAAFHIKKLTTDAIMVVLTADHLISNLDSFREILVAGAEVAKQDWLVTLGIKPDYPETGYGYIEQGSVISFSPVDLPIYQVARFVEKPNYEKAVEYLSSGNFSWNSGMFIWKVGRILEEMLELMPVLYDGLAKISSKLGTDGYKDALLRFFPELPINTIDYGIMERAEKVAVIPSDIGWNDIGSWAALYDVIEKDQNGNVILGRNLSLDTTGSLIYSSNRLISTIGLKDMIVIDTEDVVLICPRSRSQDVKIFVSRLKAQGKLNYL